MDDQEVKRIDEKTSVTKRNMTTDSIPFSNPEYVHGKDQADMRHQVESKWRGRPMDEYCDFIVTSQLYHVGPKDEHKK